ncbi:MAG: alpha/beta fold hydrolase [Elusimicrobia bacterium]|nr:alpha/beta fold hydrolase [Elusimicrobiota bacterium]
MKFKTSDGCLIAASYGAPAKGKLVFVNIHGLGSNKGEWGAFEKILKARSAGWLSLDLRGHGQSLECAGIKADYRAFGPGDWNAAAKDIAAAVDWLKKRKIPASRTALCGASVGANLALKAAVDHSLKPAAVIMLSPGLVYAGVGIEEYFLRPLPFSLLLAASPDDYYAWQSSMRLFEEARIQKLPASSKQPAGHSAPAHSEKAVFRQGVSGHGVNMFSGAGAPLMEEIALWAAAR